MKLLRKILSNKGQLSMEVGILVAAAVAVAAIAAYFYVSNVKKAQTNAGNAANNTTSKLESVAENYVKSISNL